MAFIYKIVNDINDKVYVGKTLKTPQERFREHCHESKKKRCEKRPLYSAMNKYGIEHFSVETIEECSSEEVDEREQFWVIQYNTLRNGYNATAGGDGKGYIDRKLVVSTYMRCKSCIETAKIIGCHKDTVSDILKEQKIDILKSSEVLINKTKPINMYNNIYEKKLIKSFKNLHDAYEFLIKEEITKATYRMATPHICAICAGNSSRKSAYGFYWEYANN